MIAVALAFSATAYASAHYVSAEEIPTENYVGGIDTNLYQTLNEIGTALNCHFTIEDSSQDSAPLRQRPMPDLPTPTLIPATITLLQSQLPDCRVFQDAKVNSVIHVEFAGLEADNEYVLSKLRDLDFSGPIYGLELKISKAEGKRLQINDGFGSLILTDFTPTSVHATNESNRAILTDSLPLNRYDRILWEAYTDYGVSNAGTLMQFNGPYAPRYAK